jgi:hypothetical protein
LKNLTPYGLWLAWIVVYFSMLCFEFGYVECLQLEGLKEQHDSRSIACY